MKIGAANRKVAAACDGQRLILKTLFSLDSLEFLHVALDSFLNKLLQCFICCFAVGCNKN